MHVDDPRVRMLVNGALAWTLLAIPAVLFLPLGSTSSSTSDSNTESGTKSISLVESDGWGVVPVLLVTLVLVAVARAWGQRSRAALVVPATLYDLGVVLAIASVGIFFVPAALALTIAALARRD
jgi:hypothetical protein